MKEKWKKVNVNERWNQWQELLCCDFLWLMITFITIFIVWWLMNDDEIYKKNHCDKIYCVMNDGRWMWRFWLLHIYLFIHCWYFWLLTLLIANAFDLIAETSWNDDWKMNDTWFIHCMIYCVMKYLWSKMMIYLCMKYLWMMIYCDEIFMNDETFMTRIIVWLMNDKWWMINDGWWKMDDERWMIKLMMRFIEWWMMNMFTWYWIFIYS
jgi:hypothetical protein